MYIYNLLSKILHMQISLGYHHPTTGPRYTQPAKKENYGYTQTFPVFIQDHTIPAALGHYKFA